jgi:hypothetical protein
MTTRELSFADPRHKPVLFQPLSHVVAGGCCASDAVDTVCIEFGLTHGLLFQNSLGPDEQFLSVALGG